MIGGDIVCRRSDRQPIIQRNALWMMLRYGIFSLETIHIDVHLLFTARPSFGPMAVNM